MALRVKYVRHAEAECNLADRENIICGRSPGFDLTERGVSQAKELGRLIARNYSDDRNMMVYSSCSRRALQTALIAFDTANIPSAVELREEIREKSHGECEGYNRYDIFANAQEADTFFANPDNRLPGGESDNDVTVRTMAFLNTISRIHDDSTDVYCFTHTGVIKNLFRGCGLSIPSQLDFTSITSLTHGESGLWTPELTVSSVNDLSPQSAI